MTYLELCTFLELFTIRNYRKYDKDLLTKCRIFILSKSHCQYRRFSFDSHQLPCRALLDYLKSNALLLSKDEYRLISCFCDYVVNLTNYD